jgi:hypothetical protein
MLTAKTITISVARQSYHLFIIFIFFFRHRFSVGAGGAGSIDCILESSEAAEFLNFGKGEDKELEVIPKERQWRTVS